jgi:hypothetical protein
LARQKGLLYWGVLKNGAPKVLLSTHPGAKMAPGCVDSRKYGGFCVRDKTSIFKKHPSMTRKSYLIYLPVRARLFAFALDTPSHTARTAPVIWLGKRTLFRDSAFFRDSQHIF